MRYSPENEQGLLGLVAALKAGMSPEVGYNMFQDIRSEQASDIAQRQERLGGLADLLMQGASSGVPYAGAQAMAEAAPGPAGPAVQNMLRALYPEGEQAPPGTNYLGNELDGPQGSTPGTPLGMAYGAPPAGPEAMSPMYAPPEPSMGEQVQMEQLQQQQALEPLWVEYSQNASIYASQGKTREQFISDAMKAYPELFGADIQTAQQIALTAFAAPATGV